MLNAIKELSMTNYALHKMINEEYGDQKGITALVHALSIFIHPIDLHYKWDVPGINGYKQFRLVMVESYRRK